MPASGGADFLVELAAGALPDLRSFFGAMAELEQLQGIGRAVGMGRITQPQDLSGSVWQTSMTHTITRVEETACRRRDQNRAGFRKRL